MTDHPINMLLRQTADGSSPSLKEIAALGLPDGNRAELEAAIAEVEEQSDAAQAAARLISRLPSAYQEPDYRNGDQLDPRDLAARLPQT